MTRTADPARRAEMLEQIVDYVFANGLGGLSLRPLAAAIGSSPRLLLYYFHSKEHLTSAILEGVRSRQLAGFTALRNAEFDEPMGACLAAWQAASDPQHEALMTFFFDVFALALRDRTRYARFLHNAIEEWVNFLAEPALRAGASTQDARDFGTLVLAGFRGFMMDLCATHDRARLDRSVKLWLSTFDALLAQQGTEHAR